MQVISSAVTAANDYICTEGKPSNRKTTPFSVADFKDGQPNAQRIIFEKAFLTRLSCTICKR